MIKSLQLPTFLFAVFCAGSLQLNGQALEAKIFKTWKPDLKLTSEYLKKRELKFDDGRRSMFTTLRFEFKKDKTFEVNLEHPFNITQKGTFTIDKLDEQKKQLKLTLKVDNPSGNKSIIALQFLKMQMREVLVIESSTDVPIVMVEVRKKAKK